MSETQRVAERNRSLEERLTRASGEVSELKLNLETVQREALTDSLTGIPNRKSFETHLREAARDAMENDEPLSLLIADIDHFKRFNDTYGHQIGDQVLRLVAKTLTDSVKGRDTPTRFGGEEFAIVLPQTRLGDARVVAEQIRLGLTRRKLVGRDKRDDYGSVTVSFGAAQFRPGEPLASLIERADVGALSRQARRPQPRRDRRRRRAGDGRRRRVLGVSFRRAPPPGSHGSQPDQASHAIANPTEMSVAGMPTRAYSPKLRRTP